MSYQPLILTKDIITEIKNINEVSISQLKKYILSKNNNKLDNIINNDIYNLLIIYNSLQLDNICKIYLFYKLCKIFDKLYDCNIFTEFITSNIYFLQNKLNNIDNIIKSIDELLVYVYNKIINSDKIKKICKYIITLKYIINKHNISYDISIINKFENMLKSENITELIENNFIQNKILLCYENHFNSIDLYFLDNDYDIVNIIKYPKPDKIIIKEQTNILYNETMINLYKYSTDLLNVIYTEIDKINKNIKNI